MTPEQKIDDFLKAQHGTAGWEQKLVNLVEKMVKEARAQMAQEAFTILHKLLLNTRHMEAVLLGEEAQKEILQAGVEKIIGKSPV